MDITRHEKQCNLRIDSRKCKLRICRKPEVLLSSFDSNAACDIMVSFTLNMRLFQTHVLHYNHHHLIFLSIYNINLMLYLASFDTKEQQ